MKIRQRGVQGLQRASYTEVRFIGGPQDGSLWGLRHISRVMKFGRQNYVFELQDEMNTYQYTGETEDQMPATVQDAIVDTLFQIIELDASVREIEGRVVALKGDQEEPEASSAGGK